MPLICNFLEVERGIRNKLQAALEKNELMTMWSLSLHNHVDINVFCGCFKECNQGQLVSKCQTPLLVSAGFHHNTLNTTETITQHLFDRHTA